MTRRRTRGTAGVLGALAMLFAAGAQAVAGAVLWTMTASPLTATVGTPTTFTLTATSLDPLLPVKCVVAEIPSAIAAGDVWIVGSSTTAAWVASRSGQQVTAMIDMGDGNKKLQVGDWVAFAVTGVPLKTGSYAIPAVAYSGHDCFTAARALAAPPVIVISQQVIAPPPPDPTPSPTPAPTPTAEPIVELPSLGATLPPLISVQSTSTPRSTRPTASATAALPGAIAQAQSSPEAQANTPSSPAAAPATSSGPLAAGSVAASDGNVVSLTLGRSQPGDGDAGIELGPLAVIDGVGVWAIPGAIVGGPGLLVILWVAIQAGAAVAWVPAIRRLRGDGRFGGVARRT